MTRQTAHAALKAIDARVAERNLLLHPFYQSWVEGTLPMPALRDYAKQYYRHVAAFPTYLSGVHSHTEDAETRRHVLANLIDEEAGHPNHPELWLRFAEGIGVDRAEVATAKPWEETEGLVGAFRAICRDRSTAEGLAALYAYESQIPAVAESKIAGLKKFYGVTEPRTLSYFEVHIEADREHAAVERKLLESHLSEENASAAADAAGEVLEALWEALSGVCRRHELPC